MKPPWAIVPFDDPDRLAALLGQRARHAVGRAADVVEAHQIRMRFEQAARLAVVVVGVVLALAQADHGEFGEALLHHV